MGSEIHYEGWLIKSPPTKRIWRARWRRRWFALKQGELPGQYLLEYYTDETCRKLKGVIDLDQCEQVDAGLFMERKFQHVFNVKTPHRTYYLAADSDDAMRYWVNCICNVCGLQDLSKVPPEDEAPPAVPPAQPSYFNINAIQRAMASPPMAVPSEERTYQNNDFVQKILSENFSRNNEAHKFNTIQPKQDRLGNSSQFSTLPPASRKGIVDMENINNTMDDEGARPDHEYYNDLSSSSPPRPTSSGATKPGRPIPEKLKLTDNAVFNDTGEPSPALSTASGPYIPISECYTGSPKLNKGHHPSLNNRNGENTFAPLNSLSRNNKFDVPRSPLNIGHLNLTEGPPQSPKRPYSLSGAGRSSDDSESVFTDDEMASSHSGSATAGEAQMRRAGGTLDRRLRPSDSSIENENIGWTAMQRYSKVPCEEKKCLNSSDPPPRPPKHVNEPIYIGPLDSSSCVAEERYEIPRSHRNPNRNTFDVSPDLVHSGEESAPPVEPKRRSHFYTNAAPTSLEGQVFRYDFTETSETGAPPPAINRNLKPKTHVPSKSCDQIETPPTSVGYQGVTGFGSFDATTPGGRSTLNRLLKPSYTDDDRSGPLTPRASLILARSLQMTPSRSDDKLQYLDLDHTNATAAIAVPPPRPESFRKLSSASAHNIHTATAQVGLSVPSLATIKHSISEHNTLGMPIAAQTAAMTSSSSSNVVGACAAASTSGRGIVYKTVDFVKTQAFNRTRQDAEMNRASNKDK